MANLPPGFSGYPRGIPAKGERERLALLADAYFGLNKVFGVNILFVLGFYAIAMLGGNTNNPLFAGAGLLAWMGIGILGIGFLSYPHILKIAEGKGWSPSSALPLAMVMGANAMVCCGAIGIMVLQHMAYRDIQKLGVVPRTFGIKREDVDERLRQMDLMQPPAEPPTSG